MRRREILLVMKIAAAGGSHEIKDYTAPRYVGRHTYSATHAPQ